MTFAKTDKSTVSVRQQVHMHPPRTGPKTKVLLTLSSVYGSANERKRSDGAARRRGEWRGKEPLQNFGADARNCGDTTFRRIKYLRRMFTRGNVAIFFVAGWLTIFSNNILESFSRPSDRNVTIVFAPMAILGALARPKNLPPTRQIIYSTHPRAWFLSSRPRCRAVRRISSFRMPVGPCVFLLIERRLRRELILNP